MFLEFLVKRKTYFNLSLFKEMDSFLVSVSRWMLATLLVFGAMQQSESISFQLQPDNPTRVVLGDKRVSLKWEFTPDSGETINLVFFKRQKPGDVVLSQIASRSDSGSFDMEQDFNDRSNYEAKLNSELVILDVNKHQDYIYTLSIISKHSGSGVRTKDDQVRVEVKVPPELTVVPERKPQVVVGQNFTLRCNASGDPRPNITWTKDGIPENQFNVSGGLLHLVRVERKDLGSYRCTASNGYGSNATSVSIVSMQCNNDVCEVKKVGLTIVSEEWKQAYSNKASVEFKTMESSVLAAIWGPYTNNLEKNNCTL
ncbi:hypothetical protein OS493_024262 [Desmophyllum pertusum]|uniref:Ig-like domain-containing protein n=1 Tax=Desmophyllum pertusum TaxID=174260 RepID=A0A9W9YY50_9CNID|nr:hypothetical protein OS493_024262 [Desmophyllum pertusum]